MGYATTLDNALRVAGVPFIEVGGWETRGGIDFDPVGIANHHTAGSVKGGMAPSYRQIVNDSKRGVLANLYISRDPKLYLVAAGKCAHAGRGLTAVRKNVAKDIAPRGDARDVYGHLLGQGISTENRYYYGIEVENDGIGEPYSDALLDLLVATNAAICTAHGWTHNRCIHHRESTSRKIDMSWRGDLRGEVAKAMRLGLHAPEPEDDDMPKPTDVVDVLDIEGGGCWKLYANGFVRQVRGPDYGHYQDLPANARQGDRYFVAITARHDRPGYTIWGSDGASYSFPL